MKKVKLSQDTSNSPGATEGKWNSASDHSLVAQGHSLVSNHDVRQVDPLKIKMVLERVFSFCSAETLKTCRLVSTQWRDDSMKTWRDNAILKTTNNNRFIAKAIKFNEYLQLLESDKDDDNVPAKLRNLKRYPFKRFWFLVLDELNEFSKENLEPIADITRHVKIYYEREGATSGGQIHELRYFLSNFRSLKVLSFELGFCDDGGWSLDLELPTLKHLEIVQHPSCSAQVWSRVLHWFPNVEALSLKYLYFGDHKLPELAFLSNLTCILSSLRRIRQSGEKMPLKELEIHMPETINCHNSDSVDDISSDEEEIIYRIVKCNFPLERLTIYFGMDWDEIKIHELWKSFKDTLQYLKTSLYFDVDSYVKPPSATCISISSTICMGQLREASLGSGHHRALYLLTHLKLPKLAKLTIEKDRSLKKTEAKNRQLSFPKGRVYEKLEILEFLDDRTTLSPKTMETLAKMMPNLTQLTIPLDKKSFHIVCKSLKRLKTLNILSAQVRHEELDDETLTGVSKVKQEGGTRPPNITDLCHLTDLKIDCGSQLLGNDVKFTDHSVIYGFLQISRLYSLSIAFKDLSDGMWKKLLNHVKGYLCIQENPPIVDNLGIEFGDTSGSETDSDEANESSEWEDEG